MLQTHHQKPRRFFDIFSGKLPTDLPEISLVQWSIYLLPCLLKLNLGSDWEVYETSYSSEKNVIGYEYARQLN